MSEKFRCLPNRGAVHGYREFHRTRNDAIVNYLLAMFFVFRVMDETTWNNDTLAGHPHPPAPIRFHAACIHLDEHFKRTGNVEAQAQLWQTEIWELGEIIFAKTLDRKPNPMVKRRTMSEESERHYNLISDRVQTLPQHLFGLAEDS
jgi:hypothetical protein